MSPGLAIDKHILSSRDLETYADPPHAWSPAHAMQALKGMAFSFRVVSSNLTQTSANMRWVTVVLFRA